MDALKYLGIVVALLGTYLYWPTKPLPRSLYEWRMKGDFHKYGTHKIFYRDEPGSALSGSTLVCLHGFPSSSYDWVKIVAHLRKRFARIVFLDFIGFGFSDKPADYSYSLLDQADIVESLLRELNINLFHLLSHDYGDTVAQELIHRHDVSLKAGNFTYKIESLCLLNGGMFPETNFPSPIQRLLVLPGLGSLLCRFMSYYTFEYGFGRVFGPKTRPSEEEMWDFWSLIRVNNGYMNTHKLLGYMSERWTYRDQWVGALQNTAVPLHTIYGPADVINPPETFIPFYKETLPKAGLTVMEERIGHYPQWEAPSALLKAYYVFLDDQNARIHV